MSILRIGFRTSAWRAAPISFLEAEMALEHNNSEAAEAKLDTVAATHHFIGQSWMGWAALYAVLMLLDQFTGG